MKLIVQACTVYTKSEIVLAFTEYRQDCIACLIGVDYKKPPSKLVLAISTLETKCTQSLQTIISRHLVHSPLSVIEGVSTIEGLLNTKILVHCPIYPD